MKKLEGGFINNVLLAEDGVVVKIFCNDDLVGVSSIERIQKESTALKIFGGYAAPRLISCEMTLRQEFVEGESYEKKARRGEKVFRAAGALLADIHGFFHSDTNCGRLFRYYNARFSKASKLARPILKLEKLSPAFKVSLQMVSKWRSTYIHGDFWLGNILGKEEEKPKAIDWEFSGWGSPYEDFAIADLWIFREFPDSEDEFWAGYGGRPDKKTIDAFLILRCVEFLATPTLNDYLREEKDGFYHNKVAVLKTLCV